MAWDDGTTAARTGVMTGEIAARTGGTAAEPASRLIQPSPVTRNRVTGDG
jgi:hypothetical protein